VDYLKEIETAPWELIPMQKNAFLSLKKEIAIEKCKALFS